MSDPLVGHTIPEGIPFYRTIKRHRSTVYADCAEIEAAIEGHAAQPPRNYKAARNPWFYAQGVATDDPRLKDK